jgi:ABC-type sulfate transport system permease subunit
VSGRISGTTNTSTTYIDERFQRFDEVGTYAAAVVLAIAALAALGAMTWFARSESESSHGN